MHHAGDAGVVDFFVETLPGLVAVVLSALEQVVHGHGVAVVVDVVAAGVGRGRGQRVGAVRVPYAEGDLRGRGGEQAQRAGEVLHVVPRRHVAGVARLQLVVQALHQLILGSGGDSMLLYIHAF